MSQELKPCPFCGSDARWAMTTEQDDWEIQCTNLDCHILIICNGATGKEVADAWNTRAEADSRELYAALKLARAWIGKEPHITERLDAAIRVYESRGK